MTLSLLSSIIVGRTGVHLHTHPIFPADIVSFTRASGLMLAEAILNDIDAGVPCRQGGEVVVRTVSPTQTGAALPEIMITWETEQETVLIHSAMDYGDHRALIARALQSEHHQSAPVKVIQTRSGSQINAGSPRVRLAVPYADLFRRVSSAWDERTWDQQVYGVNLNGPEGNAYWNLSVPFEEEEHSGRMLINLQDLKRASVPQVFPAAGC